MKRKLHAERQVLQQLRRNTEEIARQWIRGFKKVSKVTEIKQTEVVSQKDKCQQSAIHMFNLKVMEGVKLLVIKRVASDYERGG